MVKHISLMMMAFLLGTAVNAQVWVGFSKSEPAAPEVNVLTSDTRNVSFEVIIPGIYKLDTVVNGVAFTRLILPDGFAVNPAGSPELPVLSYKVAIPDCDGVAVSYSVTSKQNMPPCWVYPTHQYVLTTNSDGCDENVEQFYFDPAAYSQPRPVEPVAIVVSDGALRKQKYAEIMIQPAEFCPVTRQLAFVDKVVVTLAFTNPAGDLIQDVGVFSQAVSEILINFPSNGLSALSRDRAFERPNFVPGKVKWINITNPNQVDTIKADYLILCAGAFFNNQHDDVQRLAAHRAWYNGMTVAILNVEQIISDAVGFYFEGTIGNPNNPEFKKEQRMRTCIRRIYEKQVAPYSLDFVLLVGDCKHENTFMPTSYNHNVTVNLPAGKVSKVAADIYFSCLTRKADGSYYDDTNLFIGRLSVEDGEQLYNMVEKTIHHETGRSGAWRKKALFTNGNNNFSQPYHTQYFNFTGNMLAARNWNQYIVAHQPIQAPTLNYWNTGVVYTQYIGGGSGCVDKTTWDQFFNVEAIGNGLNNDKKNPFIAGLGNNYAGWFDDDDCLGEFITRYSSTKGAIGYIGASRGAEWGLSSPIDTTKLSFHEAMPFFLFKKNNYPIAGELLFMAKSILKPQYSSEKIAKYGYNLLGDPALNIMAPGFDCETLAYNAVLSTSKVLNYGDCLEIPANGLVTMSASGSITLNGGRLIIGNNAKIVGPAQSNPNIFIKLVEGTLEMGENVTFENINFSTTVSLSKVHFKNVNFTRATSTTSFTLANCTFTGGTATLNNGTFDATVTNTSFTNTNLSLKSAVSNPPKLMKFSNSQFTGSTVSHEGRKFETTGSTFTNSTLNLKNENGNATITNTSFTDSQLNTQYQTGATPMLMDLNNVQFSGTTISHSNHQFNANNCTFTGGTATLNNGTSDATVTNSSFTNTNLTLKSTVSSPPKLMKFSNSQFTGSTVSHEGRKFETTGSTFTNCTVTLKNEHGDAKLTNSSFTNSKLVSQSQSGYTASLMELNNVQFTGSTINHFYHQFSTTNSAFTDCTVNINNSKSNANVTNTTFTDCLLQLSSDMNNVPYTMKFSDCELTNSPIVHFSHKLEAINCTFANRSDIRTSYPVTDIKDCYFWKSGIYATTPISTPMPGQGSPFEPFIKITGCSFNNTGQFVAEAGEHPVISKASIWVNKIKEFHISGNTIININSGIPQAFPFGEGIYLNEAGQGSVNNRWIMDNDISGCETGLYIYGSKATVKNNDIHDNGFGVRLFNNSSTSFTGEANTASGEQFIRNNGSYGVYASKFAFPLPFKYNQITKNNVVDSIMIYYDITRTDNPGGFQIDTLLDVRCNYWQHYFLSTKPKFIYPWEYYRLTPYWDPQTGVCATGGKSPYDDGIDYFVNDDYPSAKAAFLQQISTYPDDPFSIAALHELFSLEQFIDNDYAALHNYYATFTPADSALFDVADFLATRCNVVIQNWQPAIDWYEDRIENPPSYQDSVFAVIDLGDIHLMMEDDSLKACRVFRFPNIKPKSRQQYEENKSALLATLPKIDQPRPQHPLAGTGKKGVLSQNIPNPAKESTTIVYDVLEEGSVHLRIYNQLGQLLQDLPQGTQKPGSYRLEVSLVGMPAGVYHYVLFVEGEKADWKKLVVN